MTITVYYIDDEPMICENFQDEFESDEVVIKTFLDPQDAVKEAQTQAPDLIFIDFRFPKATGEEVANALPPDIPKILVTGDLNIKTSYEFKATLTKPAPSDEIFAILDAMLKEKAS